MRKFTRIPKSITFQRAGVSAHMIGTYAALADFADNKSGLCWPRMDTLASTLGISVRSVQRHLAALQAAGLVEFVERRRSARGRFSSWCYRLVLMASFNKPTTGHRGPVGPAAPYKKERKQRKNTPPDPPIKGPEGARRRQQGYEWLFRDPGEADGSR